MQPIQQRAMSPEIIKKIEDAAIIAVLVVDEVKHAGPLANALLEGGVDAIELTLRTSAAMEVARIIKKEVPQMTLGFGTVLTVEQVRAVADVGADFAVAPGCNPKVIAEAYKQSLSFAPGIMTPTDIEIAVQEGCRILKFFPAETSGGLQHLQSMSCGAWPCARAMEDRGPAESVTCSRAHKSRALECGGDPGLGAAQQRGEGEGPVAAWRCNQSP